MRDDVGTGVLDAGAAGSEASGTAGESTTGSMSEEHPQSMHGAAEMRQEDYWRRQAEKMQKEIERLTIEKDAMEKTTAEAATAVQQRVVLAEARLQALQAGVRPERVAAALRLADLSNVAMDENGEPDAKALQAAVAEVITGYPEFAVQPQAPVSKGGSDFSSGAGDPPLNDDVIAGMSLEELKRRMPEIQAFYAKRKK